MFTSTMNMSTDPWDILQRQIRKMDIVKNLSCLPAGDLNCSLPDQKLHYITIPTFMFIPLLTALFCVFVFNSGVFILIIKEKKIRGNPYYFLVLMLSVSDFTIGLGIMCGCIKQMFPYLHANSLLTISQMHFITTGLYLSLLQIFLISLQRYLIVSKEKVHMFLFKQKRKYFVCFGCWMVVLLINFFLISPSRTKFNPSKDRITEYVYNGHYMVYRALSRFLSTILLLFTLILYVLTIKHIKTQSLKIHPKGKSNDVPLKVNPIRKCQLHVAPQTSAFEENGPISQTTREVRNPIVQIRHKKVIGTLYLVGLLISALLVFTGPLIVSLWVEECSPRVMGVLLCINILNAVANPILYIWKLVDFRKYVKSTLCCCPSKSQE